MNLGQTLTTADVVKDLGLSKGTVSRWIIEGKIPAIKVGRNYKIPLEPYLRAKAALIQVQYEDPTVPAIAKLISDWINHLQNGPTPYAAKTIDDYRHNLLRFVRLLGGVSSLQELFDKRAGIKAIEAIPPQSYAVRCHIVSSVVSFAKFAVAQGLVPESVIGVSVRV